ncbi:hypothetical protein [Streptomyces chartreusis]|uniref:hypothetical protein n=1 Tax=Streptomyces chartreusis TaxID=1969 RepID=UPI0033C455F5
MLFSSWGATLGLTAGGLVDQGAAAVLGAAVGVVGTAGTSLLTFWGLRWQTRQQHQSSVDQWRRGVRRDVYVQFLEREQAWSRAALDAINAVGKEEPNLAEVTRAGDECHKRWNDLQFMRETVELEGPESIISASEAMLPLEQRAFRALFVAIDAARDSAGSEERNRLVEAFVECNNEQAAAARRFRRAAREVLDMPASVMAGLPRHS